MCPVSTLALMLSYVKAVILTCFFLKAQRAGCDRLEMKKKSITSLR